MNALIAGLFTFNILGILTLLWQIVTDDLAHWQTWILIIILSLFMSYVFNDKKK